jgi:hypothetical protein
MVTGAASLRYAAPSACRDSLSRRAARCPMRLAPGCSYAQKHERYETGYVNRHLVIRSVLSSIVAVLGQKLTLMRSTFYTIKHWLLLI